MQKKRIKIKKIPLNIKLKYIFNINKQFKIVGYKKIKIQYIVPIIELNNYTRIWLLSYEIKPYI